MSSIHPQFSCFANPRQRGFRRRRIDRLGQIAADAQGSPPAQCHALALLTQPIQKALLELFG